MIEHSYKVEASPLVYHGDHHSGTGLCEMTLNSLKRHEGVIGRLVEHNKDLSGAKEIKKATSVWTLFFVALFGAFVLYVCLARVDPRLASPELSFGNSYQGDFGLCPQSSRNSTDGILDHYPKPGNYNREECACTPVHYFVILSMQRSGSGWFETLLNDHPNISSHGEIFSVKPRRENFTTIRETLENVYNLEWKSSAAKNACTSAVGHKWMTNQGVMEYHKEIADYYNERGVSVVLLLRRNLLKRLISVLANTYDKEHKLLNGTHKSHVHKPEEAKVLAAYKPTINVKTLPGTLRQVEEITANVLHFFNSTRRTVVYYEDLVKDPKRRRRGPAQDLQEFDILLLGCQQNVLEVQKFLGVPPRDLSSKQVKIHTLPLQEQIENWEEVLTGLTGTEHESFLGDNDYS